MNNIGISQSLNPMIEQNKEPNKIIKENKNIESPEKPIENTTEVGTTVSSLFFLHDKSNLEKLQVNLNNQIQKDTIPKDTISTSTGTESVSSQQDNNSTNSNINKPKTFAGKTKQWAGNVWTSIKNIKNIKNIFPKTEYEEYRNANGDIVKIPKKKIPLKKKKQINDNVNNRIAQEQNKVVSTYHGVATGLYLVS